MSVPLLIVMAGFFVIAATVNIAMLWRALARAERRIDTVERNLGAHMRHHVESLDRREGR